jgi:hypothetical protein
LTSKVAWPYVVGLIAVAALLFVAVTLVAVRRRRASG